MAVPDVTEKTEIYHTLYQLSLAFATIVQHCDTMRQRGMLTAKYTRLYQAFAQELEGELHSEILTAMQGVEEDDWNRFGRVRDKWEKYLRGPKPRSKKKTA
jgi:flagellar biosynthesis chaperone FliJ